MSKPITIKDVASAAGVSKSTVERALNESGCIEVATRSRILEAARSLGYSPNRVA